MSNLPFKNAFLGFHSATTTVSKALPAKIYFKQLLRTSGVSLLFSCIQIHIFQTTVSKADLETGLCVCMGGCVRLPSPHLLTDPAQLCLNPVSIVLLALPPLPTPLSQTPNCSPMKRVSECNFLIKDCIFPSTFNACRGFFMGASAVNQSALLCCQTLEFIFFSSQGVTHTHTHTNPLCFVCCFFLRTHKSQATISHDQGCKESRSLLMNILLFLLSCDLMLGRVPHPFLLSQGESEQILNQRQDSKSNTHPNTFRL